ncbi:hypothetical protein PWG14_20855 (plasmid) [Chromobacterium amazonense]|uniref:hypothetical protein n=1 Tax=Chromobacterium amazonense TaxID=1382803 RepID=UPI00237DA7EC|nr:hypothetical protein [Chromobacterium amazonense]MDE1714942.1 hypothetical protein [Chromobacterium amazonense]
MAKIEAEVVIKKMHGVNIKKRTGTVKPVSIDLSNSSGDRVVAVTAKRVIARHKKVIKALADR